MYFFEKWSRSQTSQHFLSPSRLHPLDFSLDEIRKIVRSLDLNKPHGHDDIVIRMTEMCGKSLVTQLSLPILIFLSYQKKNEVLHLFTKKKKKQQTKLQKLLPHFTTPDVQ